MYNPEARGTLGLMVNMQKLLPYHMRKKHVTVLDKWIGDLDKA